MSEYDDIVTLHNTGCWPGRKEPQWAVDYASVLETSTTHAAVQIEGLMREVKRLRVAPNPARDFVSECNDLISVKDTVIKQMRDLLREAIDHMDDTSDGWSEDWCLRAAEAAGGK